MSRLILSALFVVLTFVGPASAQPPFRFPEGICDHGELRYINGVPVLTVDGTPDQMGAAVGILALGPGRRMASYPDDVLSEFYLSLLRTPLLYAGKQMVKQFPPEYRWEMEAMANAAHIHRDMAILGNTMFDLKKIIACSALLVEPQRSATGGTLMGRNLDYPSLGYAHEYTLVTVFRPKGAKHAFATVGFPGVVGCLSGMNDAGLAVAVLEVAQVKSGETRFNPDGLPYALCYRKLLENCSTIDEAAKLLSSLPRTGLSNLVVADRQSVATFEITPERVVVRRGTNGTCACANHFCTNELKPEVGINFFDTHGRFDRLAKVGELDRRLAPADLQVGLHQSCHEKFTLQTMIFDCAALRLHLSAGTIPASAGEMKTVELGPLFFEIVRGVSDDPRIPPTYFLGKKRPGWRTLQGQGVGWVAASRRDASH